MGIFSSKPKVDMEEFCQTYYDSQMFQHDSQKILDYAFQQLTSAYPSFSKLDRMLFDSEMTAMHLELFALAFFQRFFANINHTAQQSIYTFRYLNDKKKSNIWESMGYYNQIIAKTATIKRDGQQMTGESAIERMTITSVNLNRSQMSKNWVKDNKLDLNNLTEQDEVNLYCVGRVCNRFGAGILQKQEIGNRRIAISFLYRLGGEELTGKNPEPSADFYTALASQPYSMYEFANKTLKSIDLKFS